MKKFLLGVLFGAVIAGGAVYVRTTILNRRFDAVHSQFFATSDCLARLLDDVLTSYENKPETEIGRQHELYLKDGTFDLVDDLLDEQKALVGVMRPLCTRGRTAAMERAFCVCWNSENRAIVAEVPFRYKTIIAHFPEIISIDIPAGI